MALEPQTRFRLVLTAGVLFLGFVCLQFVRPPITNPPVTAEIQAPPEVKAILRNSCYNCHSNETKLAWFDQIAPAYWMVAKDVKTARAHLNFSEIGKLPAAQQKGMLFEAVNQIQMGAMPLPSYRKVHPGAALTPEQLAVLRNYLAPAASAAPAKVDIAAPMANKDADDQYAKWITASDAPLQVKPELNGIPFFSDYKNWKAISSTDRFDNHTMRQILGNDIAVKAIAENHINPWPDGAAFAKVAWAQEPDAQGTIHTGAFKQVEFMVKDRHKYASTAGWGWARWVGMDLKPYGKNANFANECIGCHNPVRQNDYVYTTPIQGGQ